MNRAVAWRLPGPTVRYDYAPRSWEGHTSGFRFSELAGRERMVPSFRKGFKVLTVLALGLAMIYAGLSFRIRYLGDGTLRVERKGAFALSTTSVSGGAKLATLGTVANLPAPSGGPGVIDAAPPASSDIDSETCDRNRRYIAANVATYNRKYPNTQIRTLKMLPLINEKLARRRSGCPKEGTYQLEIHGGRPTVNCSNHS